ncbi:MAG TPA: cob(I)yrinic acid a,c-diamide adenosyltransferase [Burkholderiales bacterium]|nr:cob(I)yrinic acid a,c-diamide adenosyltransferase [Burkholderiales bacterium]
MKHRLTKIYTRTGDNGSTGLGDGTRVAKDSLRIAVIGEIDELNSCIGVLLAEDLPLGVRTCLCDIQNDLFDLGGELCLPGHVAIARRHVERLEKTLDSLNSDLPPLKEFILPRGSRAAALAHFARTVCRRAERSLVTLSKSEKVPELSANYINRLSDLLFVIARVLNREYGDVFWQQGKNKDL